MGVVQDILNWFGVALFVFGAGLVSLVQAAPASPTFMLLAAVPLLFHLGAVWRGPQGAASAYAIAVNWVATLLAGSLAAAALVGLRGTSGLFPVLACATVLYLWNAARLAARALR